MKILSTLYAVPLISVLFMISPNGTAASTDNDPEKFVTAARALLGDSIPAITDVIPGYRRPDAEAPTLIVADFTGNRTDGLDWGRAAGQLLRWQLAYSPTVRLSMPDYRNFYTDCTSDDGEDRATVGRSLNSIRRAGRRLGIDTALTGHIEVTGNHFGLTAELRGLPAGEMIRSYEYSGDLNTVHSTLIELTATVLADLGIELEAPFHDYARRVYRMNGADIKRFVAIYPTGFDNYDDIQRNLVTRLWQEGLRAQSVGALYLAYAPVGDDLYAYRKRLDAVKQALSDDSGIELTVARYMGYREAPDLLADKLSRLKRVVSDNPQDPTAMLVLADVLADVGDVAASTTLSFELMQRWPDNYRTWWSASYALLAQAWALRGNNYWRDVDPENKKVFPALKDMADYATDQALLANEDNATLWHQKVRTVGDYNGEMMNAFNRSIRLAPKYKPVYEAALNFSHPNWGGSLETQRSIIETARKNGLDAEWIAKMERWYLDDPDWTTTLRWRVSEFIGYIRDSTNLQLTAIVLLLLVLILLRTRSRHERETINKRRGGRD